MEASVLRKTKLPVEASSCRCRCCCCRLLQADAYPGAGAYWCTTGWCCRSVDALEGVGEEGAAGFRPWSGGVGGCGRVVVVSTPRSNYIVPLCPADTNELVTSSFGENSGDISNFFGGKSNTPSSLLPFWFRRRQPRPSRRRESRASQIDDNLQGVLFFS